MYVGVEEECLVFDIGTSNVRAGISGDDIPCCFFNASENIKNNPSPISRGIVQNWDDLESLISLTFEIMKFDPSKISILFSESPVESVKQQSKICELMFEKFNVKGFLSENSGNLISYASGRTSSFVLDSGGGTTFCQASHLGNVLETTKCVEKFGGDDISNYLKSLLSSQESIQKINKIKENCCRIATSKDELKCDAVEELTFLLPDETKLSLGSEIFMATELLFQPDLNELHSSGIQQMITDSIIIIVDEKYQKLMLENIVLSGGNCCFSGLEERLRNELEIFFPNIQVKFEKISNEERKIMSWMGGSIAGCLPNYKEIIKKSKLNYEEFGHVI